MLIPSNPTHTCDLCQEVISGAPYAGATEHLDGLYWSLGIWRSQDSLPADICGACLAALVSGLRHASPPQPATAPRQAAAPANGHTPPAGNRCPVHGQAAMLPSKFPGRPDYCNAPKVGTPSGYCRWSPKTEAAA